MTATDALIERLLPTLGSHARMAGDRPFYTKCLCGWSGPATNYRRHEARVIAELIQTEVYDQARSAVLHGAIRVTAIPEGVSKDEALSLAAEFFRELEGETFQGPEATHEWVDEINDFNDFNQGKADN